MSRSDTLKVFLHSPQAYFILQQKVFSLGKVFAFGFKMTRTFSDIDMTLKSNVRHTQNVLELITSTFLMFSCLKRDKRTL